VVESFSGQERIANLALDSAAAPDGGEDESDRQSTPSWVTLRRPVSQLRSRVAQLNDGGTPDGHVEEQL
jgi:hypothetical protein